METPPGKGEFELTLFGPGYGECVFLHVGDGVWAIVDSCIDEAGTPRALGYLESISVDAAKAVRLIVATHWHDDHMRGMAQLVEACKSADFCCATALCKKEFLKISAVQRSRHLIAAGSGTDEIFNVFSLLQKRKLTPTHAIANRPIFASHGCKISSLSPSDAAFRTFLGAISNLMPSEGETKKRMPDLLPNQAAVGLWVEVDDVVVLLGSDVERAGWTEILQGGMRPPGKASAFKIPHHGSASADVPEVWQQMLDPGPFAVLAPWKKGGNALPRRVDAERILLNTVNAYSSSTAGSVASRTRRRSRMVDRMIRESGTRLQRLPMSPGAVRLRRVIGEQAPWSVTLLGNACHLKIFL